MNSDLINNLAIDELVGSWLRCLIYLLRQQHDFNEAPLREELNSLYLSLSSPSFVLPLLYHQEDSQVDEICVWPNIYASKACGECRRGGEWGYEWVYRMATDPRLNWRIGLVAVVPLLALARSCPGTWIMELVTTDRLDRPTDRTDLCPGYTE